MRKLTTTCATLLGGIGLLVCVLVAGLGWWTATRVANRIDGIAIRIDERLTQSDLKLARIEQRVTTDQAEIAQVLRSAEAIVSGNQESEEVRAKIERLQARLLPALDRVSATADSLQTLAESLRAAADLVDQLRSDPKATDDMRKAADAIDRAAAALQLPRDKLDTLAAVASGEVRQVILTFAGKAVEGSKLLADGLAVARREAVAARTRTTEIRDDIVFRVYAVAIAVTLLAIWGGLGQLCLIGYGRRHA